MKRILVVDDDKILRTVLSDYLEKQGYVVENADSAEQGLAAFAKNPPDLVISDIMMPGMDGFEFCRRLRATREGQLLPFIFLSALGQIDCRVEGHSIGADDYLLKPFHPRELVAKIEAQLERSRRIHAEIVRLMQRSTNLTSHQTPTPPPLPLTPAEERVFWEAVRGFTNKQISERLFISPRTVQSHLRNIFNKLEIENRSQLVRFAFEVGYQPPTDSECASDS
ncbi:response regulator transcription factor [Aerosakkonema funiforme]|uniref:Response regulator transcription factor n=3 Tax=Oscillatoriophycideae TaxID=1301283 RepID=A0A926VJE1_9CYAN|nr:response regulator transcription factor [Aerosakkonema funiforme]MBD2183629.1 response regulator transcription factor [Aerosakkonema funiforme FACHB-1375]